MSTPGSINELLIGAAGAGGAGYEISRSLRFNSADSAYLSRTPSTAGNRKTWTYSFWAKLSYGATDYFLRNVNSGSSDSGYILFSLSSLGDIRLSGWSTNWLQTTAVYRDPSAWYHIILVADTTQATASDRLKLYVNGSQVTQFATENYPTQNLDLPINATGLHDIGVSADFYLADIHLIDGQALDPTSFGEFDDNGIWQPIAYSGSYGTNGFHLPFSDNSTAAALGTDTSGNGNDWTVNNISVASGAGNDSVVDVPTNGTETDTGVGAEVRGNYATWFPFTGLTGISAVNGNLQYVAGASTDWQTIISTISVSSGKWYFEVTPNVDGTGGNAWFIGVSSPSSATVRTLNYFPGITTDSWGYYGLNGNKYNNNVASSYGATYTTNNVIGVALDLDNGKLFFSKNGTWQASGDPAAGTNAAYTNLTGTLSPAVAAKSSGSATLNAGQRPFAYTAPSGFKALNTANLGDPVITKPSEYMDVKLYTGNGGTQVITTEFSPDLVWIKSRSVAYWHRVNDSVRGAQKFLYSNDTSAEGTSTSNDRFTSFDATGFTLGIGDTPAADGLNQNTLPYVAWCWDAGSSTVSNTDGSITSSVRANPSAGFSICTMTTPSPSATFTFGHGLGAVPQFVIFKFRSNSSNWYTYHTSIGQKYILLNGAGAAATNEFTTAPTSTLFTYPNSLSIGPSEPLVAYCFAPVAGYSAFGSYTGNGSADGPFVYTGFRPRWVMVKCSSAGTTNWIILDSSRDEYNLSQNRLVANLSNAESATPSQGRDFLSNGFKARGTDASINSSGATYIYAAFAENSFALNARAR